MKRTLINRISLCIIMMLRGVLKDSLYLKLLFKNKLGYSLNLKNPRTFNEKIQWLKLNNKHPEYTLLVDKVEVKKYVQNKIGDKYIIPTIGVYNSLEDIPWDKLPERFVIKTTGDSGGVYICKDIKELDISKAKNILRTKNKVNYAGLYKEYPYLNVPHRFIIEEYFCDESGYELKDYKFFCFDGVPKFLYVATDRSKGANEVKFDFFDTSWNHLPFTNGHSNNPKKISCPPNFSEMLRVASELSKGIAHVRVDLYNINGNIYFGELTFFHNSGLFPFTPLEWDYKLGEYLHLPIKDN